MIIITSQPSPLIRSGEHVSVSVKVRGREGYKLRYYYIDLISKKTSDIVEEVDITRDDFNDILTFTAPEEETMIAVVAEVVERHLIVFRRPVESITTRVIFVSPNARILTPGPRWNVTIIGPNGTIHDLGLSWDVPVHPYYLTLLWKPGKLIAYKGETKIIDVEGKQALIKFALRVREDVAAAFANAIENDEVYRIVVKDPGLMARIGAVAYLKQTVRHSRISVVGADVVKLDGWYRVEAYLLMDLHSSFDWKIVVAIVGGILVGVGLILGSGLVAGIGAIALGVAFVLSGIEAGLEELVSFTKPLREALEEVVTAIDKIEAEVNAKITNYLNELNNYLTTLVNSGVILRTEYERLIDYVNSSFRTVSEGTRELKDIINGAYQDGFGKGLMLGLLGAGAVGAGVMLMKKRGG